MKITGYEYDNYKTLPSITMTILPDEINPRKPLAMLGDFTLTCPEDKITVIHIGLSHFEASEFDDLKHASAIADVGLCNGCEEVRIVSKSRLIDETFKTRAGLYNWVLKDVINETER